MTLIYRDDFNRPNDVLNSSVSTGIDGQDGGWAWVHRTGGFMSINGNLVVHGAFSNIRLDGPPIELDYELSDKISGQRVTVANRSGASGASFFTHFVNSSNYIRAGYLHSTSLGVPAAYVQVIIDGNLETNELVSHALPTLPYTVSVWSLAIGQISVAVNGVTVIDALNATADPVFATAGSFGILAFSDPIFYDDYNGGAPWLLGLAPPPSEQNESDPAVQRRLLDEQRRASLLGGRQNTILTSPLGLTDDVPIAKIHIIGRC